MPHDLCSTTRRWLAAGGDEAPPAAIVAHVAGCPRCRGALAATLAERLSAPPPGADSCARCEEDLPAAIDHERAHGPAAAARRYPHVWWHLWTCPECAELYQATAGLLDAEAVGLISPPPRLLPVTSVRLDRSFLHQVFAPQAALGSAWSDAADPMLVAEEDLPGCRIAVQVLQTAPALWALDILVDPPVAGSVLVSLGALSYRAPLRDGAARVSDIPAEQLVGGEGPDLLISIERGDADGSRA